MGRLGFGPRAIAVWGLLWLVAGAASAHVVFSRSTLRQWLQHSAASLHVEIVAGPEVWTAPSGDRQELFRARVIERIAGEPVGAEEIDFFPHAEGFPAFAPGGRYLLFLEATDTRREFAALGARFPWFSVQGAGDEWRLDPEGEAVLGSARAWAGWLAAGGEDAEGYGELIERSLASTSDALQADALRELVRAHGRPGLLAPEARARLAARVLAPGLPLARRGALLLMLADAPGFDADAAFVKLTAEAKDPDARRRLVGQLGASELAPVAPWLARLAGDPDAGVRRAVMEAEGRRGARADLDLLERGLADASEDVARAAIRSLGRHPAPRARHLLEATAAGPDATRARLAAAELRRGEP